MVEWWFVNRGFAPGSSGVVWCNANGNTGRGDYGPTSANARDKYGVQSFNYRKTRKVHCRHRATDSHYNLFIGEPVAAPSTPIPSCLRDGFERQRIHEVAGPFRKLLSLEKRNAQATDASPTGVMTKSSTL